MALHIDMLSFPVVPWEKGISCALVCCVCIQHEKWMRKRKGDRFRAVGWCTAAVWIRLKTEKIIRSLLRV